MVRQRPWRRVTSVLSNPSQETSEVLAGTFCARFSPNLGSQDTFYVGTLKGVGRIYQKTSPDTDSQVRNFVTLNASYCEA